MRREYLHILQHSIGADKYGQGGGTRNHFCAGGKDVGLCRELVGIGYMAERPSSELTGGYPLFFVTATGIWAVRDNSPKPPKLTRSQRRYREYLDSGAGDCGYTFGEWLKRKVAA